MKEKRKCIHFKTRPPPTFVVILHIILFHEKPPKKKYKFVSPHLSIKCALHRISFKLKKMIVDAVHTPLL